MAYTRITALWTGANGLPGYTRMKFNGQLDSAAAAAAAGRMRTFFDSVKTYLPAAVSISFSEAAQWFATTGELQAEVGFTPPAPVVGAATGAYSAASGVVVNWLTGGVANGRKIRGRTFLVPCGQPVYSTAGQITAVPLAAITSAAQALLAGTPYLVVAANTPAGGSGYEAQIIGATVPSRVAVLRSRRD